MPAAASIEIYPVKNFFHIEITTAKDGAVSPLDFHVAVDFIRVLIYMLFEGAAIQGVAPRGRPKC